jgi:2-polyprenyl-3-methyl-5-hydroxy-6-metoxy-1,4-benzoquinol methylase
MAVPWLRGRILDVGCGSGLLAEHCRPENYFGYDLSQISLKIARRRFPSHRFSQTIPDQTFDTIVALAVIEHLPDPVADLAIWSRHLEPGGRMVLTTPHPSVGRIHSAGAAIGLFSKDAAEEHQELIDREHMQKIASAAGLRLIKTVLFLLGANQLFILAGAAD